MALSCGRHLADDLLTTITPQQYDELLAYDHVEGIGNERLVKTVAIGMAAICRSLGSPIDWWHLIPGEEEPKQDASPEAAAKMFGAFVNGHSR